MKRWIWMGGLAGLWAAGVWIGVAGPARAQAAPQAGGAAAQQVFADRAAPADRPDDPAREIAQLRVELGELRKSLAEMDRRLGRAQQVPTVFNTFERRIEDMQRRLDRLERDLNTRIKKLEDQVQRLERQSKG